MKPHRLRTGATPAHNAENPRARFEKANYSKLFEKEYEVNEQFLKDNVLRRQLSIIEQLKTGERIEEVESVKQEEKYYASVGRPKKGEIGGKNATDKSKTRDNVGKELGISGRT